MTRPLVIGVALLLAACEPTRHLPVKIEVLDLRMPADELICHVSNIAKAQRLSLRYGKSEQPFGTMATFRLIGDDFELILLNDERPFTYHLSAYDLSDDGEAQSRAETAFAGFRKSLVERPLDKCRK